MLFPWMPLASRRLNKEQGGPFATRRPAGPFSKLSTQKVLDFVGGYLLFFFSLSWDVFSSLHTCFNGLCVHLWASVFILYFEKKTTRQVSNKRGMIYFGWLFLKFPNGVFIVQSNKFGTCESLVIVINTISSFIRKAWHMSFFLKNSNFIFVFDYLILSFLFLLAKTFAEPQNLNIDHFILYPYIFLV